MKRIYSLALLAMMAICAMVVTSCGDDEDETPDTASNTFTVLTNSGGNIDLDAQGQAEEATMSWIKEVIGVDATFTKVVNKGFTFTISKDRKAVIEKIKKADTSKLDAALAKIGCLYSFKFTIDSSEATILNYTYELNIQTYFPGTWKGSLNGVNYTLTIEAPATKDAVKFKATINDGTKDYPGELAYFMGEAGFGSDEYDGDASAYIFTALFGQEPGTIIAKMFHGQEGQIGYVTFTRQ